MSSEWCQGFSRFLVGFQRGFVGGFVEVPDIQDAMTSKNTFFRLTFVPALTLQISNRAIESNNFCFCVFNCSNLRMRIIE